MPPPPPGPAHATTASRTSTCYHRPPDQHSNDSPHTHSLFPATHECMPPLPALPCDPRPCNLQHVPQLPLHQTHCTRAPSQPHLSNLWHCGSNLGHNAGVAVLKCASVMSVRIVACRVQMSVTRHATYMCKERVCQANVGATAAGTYRTPSYCGRDFERACLAAVIRHARMLHLL